MLAWLQSLEMPIETESSTAYLLSVHLDLLLKSAEGQALFIAVLPELICLLSLRIAIL